LSDLPLADEMKQRFKGWAGRHRTLVWVIGAVFLLYALAGFVAAPLLIQHLLKTRVSHSLHRTVSAEAVRANPFTFSIRMEGLSVSDRDGGPFMKVAEVGVNLDPLLSLLKWGLVVQSVGIIRPDVRVVRTGSDRFNFSDLLSGSGGPAPEAPPKKNGPLRLVLGTFEMTAGVLRFIDKTQTPAFETVISPLDAALTGLDTRPGAEAFNYRLRGQTEARERLELEGLGRLDPFEVRAAVQLKELVPAKYASYYHPYFRAEVSDGRVSLGGRFQWSEKETSLRDLTVRISGLALQGSEDRQTLARLPLFDLDGGDMDFIGHRIGLGRISAKGAWLRLVRDPEGNLNLASLLPPRSKADASPGASPEPSAPADTPAWQITLPTLKVADAAIEFEDRQTVPAATTRLHHLSLKAEGISTLAQSRGRLDLTGQWADRGTLGMQGELGLNPLAAQLDVDVRDLDIRPLQPYLQPYAQLVVTRGDFNTQGQLNLKSAGIRYSGRASLDGFEVVDKPTAGLFSKWKSLRLTGIDVNTAPMSVAVDEISLSDFFDRLTVLADGSTNLDAVFGRKDRASGGAAGKSEGAPSGSAPAAKEQKDRKEKKEAPIVIRSVTLQGGRIDYTDLSIKPTVQLAMAGLKGHVRGLDNLRENRADVLLQGMLGGNVPMEINGRLNPFVSPPYLDMTVDFPGFDLSPFTPYAGKFLGYKLEKGQLSFDLAYKVVDNRMEGRNRIHFNQLSFGDTVSSPQATKLPIKLAVALLKDRKGNIDLNLPVTGDMKDPQFSIGGVILKMFRHLITDIVSSPFKALGAIFGGGAQLAYLDFAAGQSGIGPQGRKKLDTLAKILFERPGLKLEIKGQVDPERDTDGLRRLMFEEHLKAAKLKALVAKGRKAVPLEQIELGPQERDELIRKAYGAAKFSEPASGKEEKGRAKPPTPGEMEARLLKTIEVKEDALRLLAHRRALAAKEYLLATGKVEASRLFIIEPDLAGHPQDKPKAQVQFSLK
jgi:Domain of Unknown Function (DUF748)